MDQEIKKVEENPGLVPQGEHPGTYLDKLKARKKKHEENLEDSERDAGTVEQDRRPGEL